MKLTAGYYASMSETWGHIPMLRAGYALIASARPFDPVAAEAFERRCWPPIASTLEQTGAVNPTTAPASRPHT